MRFLRLAERRIAEMSKRGIVCYISSYSYLSDPSFVVVRKRLCEEFNYAWLDCLNGDSRETGKLTPDGKPDPSIFSTEYNREGIRLGTAVGLFAKTGGKEPVTVRYREFWGTDKRAALLKTLENTDNFDAAVRTGEARRREPFLLPAVQYRSQLRILARSGGAGRGGADQRLAGDAARRAHGL